MRFLPTRLKDVVLVEPDVFKDSRGFFSETYHLKKFEEAGLKTVFVQDNHSQSKEGTLRGLHGQLRHPQGKLVHVTQGEAFDVAVDARPDSPTFGQWVGEALSETNHLLLYIPPGFLHGFCVMSPVAKVEYKCTDFYDPSDEVGVRWDDPDLAIQWPHRNPILSAKDAALRAFGEMKAKFELYRSGPTASGA
ncbi:MAG TPA: dTDP-4-dehydrorhamnose 3,5-epimerase [bacterium]|jgi:dTDP-4-dehydrorhamnose 3,5-epimerase|nr:dTDP-4-dehydrorhamnose 3,5-epimerase [bacterium]